MSSDFKGYSIDNYDKLRPEHFFEIIHGFTDEDNRKLEIMRFLAQQGAIEERCARSRREVFSHLHISDEAITKHCNKLRDMGIIRQIRSKRQSGKGPSEVIKYYLFIENIIELLAILDAGMLGLGKDGAMKIKRYLTRLYNKSQQRPPSGPFYSLDMQKQFLEATRDVAQSYTELQKDIVNWWSTVAESSVRYYPWLYPTSFTNIASRAYRSIADYAVSGLNIAQNNFDAYIDISKIYSGLIADNIDEISQMPLINSPRTFESPSHPPALYGSSRSTGTPRTRLVETEDSGYEVYDLLKWIKLRDELAKIVHLALSSA